MAHTTTTTKNHKEKKGGEFQVTIIEAGGEEKSSMSLKWVC